MAKRIRSVLRRLVMAAFGASAVATLFLGLQTLTSGGKPPPAGIVAQPIDFRSVAPEERPPETRPAKPLPPEPKDPPPGVSGPGLIADPPPAVEQIAGLRPPATGIRIARTHSGPALQGSDDADPQPILRIPPEYPPTGRGEGWVLVQFDITPAGTVANASAVDAQPRGVFEKSALRAIERWRYRPAVMEGRAVERRGLRVMLRFELEKA